MESTSPDAVQDLPAEDYHASPALGSSGLKRFAVSPLHYWTDFRDPERERKDTAAFAFGRAWHCAVFEPDEFAARYVTMPEGLDRRTKEGKALYAELTAGGQDVLSASDAKAIADMALLARCHPISQVVFERYRGMGDAEVSLFSPDPTSGVLCKIRPDYMLAPCADFPNGLIIDGKSTGDASAEGFARDVWNYEYGLQAAFYTAVYARVFRTAGRPAFLWLAQEKAKPYAAAYYAAGQDLIDYWDARIGPLLERFAHCERTGSWPGYPTSVGTLEMPTWAQKRMEAAA